MKKYIYLYPHSVRGKDAVPNPYLKNIIGSMQKYYTFINLNRRSKTGIFNILKYYTKLDYLMLNWIEDLPDKKIGLLQSVFFIILLLLTDLTKKRVIWTMHNKISHHKKHFVLKKLLFRLLISHSDYIITHSKEGIEYLKKLNYKKAHKLKYIPHPVTMQQFIETKNKKYDILIWGSIIAYKGIDKFLSLLNDKKLLDKHRILIIGKAQSNEYFNELLKYSSEKVVIKNKYVPEDELKELISQSEVVLFTYSESSVLSSGVLMDTLSYGAKIIGPHSGAFKDLEERNLIKTYKDFNMLINILDKPFIFNDINSKNIDSFIKENTWDNYASILHKWIN